MIDHKRFIKAYFPRRHESNLTKALVRQSVTMAKGYRDHPEPWAHKPVTKS